MKKESNLSINVLDIFKIKDNDDLKRWEFTPRIEGYISYTVSYSECSSKADACIAVWKALKKEHEKIKQP